MEAAFVVFLLLAIFGVGVALVAFIAGAAIAQHLKERRHA